MSSLQSALPAPEQTTGQQYSVAVVEDLQALQVVARTLLQRHQETLRQHQLAGPLQTMRSGRALLQWLDAQQPGSVGLLLLDYQVSGGTILETLGKLGAASGAQRHPALHMNAIIIGWSIRLESAALFAQSGMAAGFISKRRPAQALVEDILTIVQHHRQHASWLELC